MADLPTCPRPNCPHKNDVYIVKETDEFWSFVCRTCKMIFVRSKPKAVARGKMEKAIKARVKKIPYEPKRLYSFLGR